MGQKTQILEVLTINALLDAVISPAIRFPISAEHLSVLVPLQIMIQDPVVQFMVLPVEVGVVEDAGLEQVVAEMWS